MNVINAVAPFEHDLLIDRPQAGLARIKARAKSLGRPSALSADQRRRVHKKIGNGGEIPAIARQFSTSRQTLMRIQGTHSRSRYFVSHNYRK